jgi:hypothetical protein
MSLPFLSNVMLLDTDATTRSNPLETVPPVGRLARG